MVLLGLDNAPDVFISNNSKEQGAKMRPCQPCNFKHYEAPLFIISDITQNFLLVARSCQSLFPN